MASDKLIEVQLAKPERHFIKVYKDFFECKGLTAQEKIAYIALKNFLDYKSDSGSVYPSIKTLCVITGLSNKTVTEALKGLERKGAIKKQRRALTKTNLYTLNDNPEMWKAETPEEMKELSESRIDLTSEEMIAELERRGAIKVIKKGESFDAQADQSDVSKPPQNSQLNIVKTTKNDKLSDSDCQQERYSLDDIKKQIGYDILCDKLGEKEADSILDLLYNTMNSTQPTIRVMKEDKPREVVISKLSNLWYEEIIDAYEKFIEQARHIKMKNPSSYLLTMLYQAQGQSHLEVESLVQYNEFGDGKSDDS